jgi:hypothetical protein
MYNTQNEWVAGLSIVWYSSFFFFLEYQTMDKIQKLSDSP